MSGQQSRQFASTTANPLSKAPVGNGPQETDHIESGIRSCLRSSRFTRAFGAFISLTFRQSLSPRTEVAPKILLSHIYMTSTWIIVRFARIEKML
jgi:hypothetical protein